MPPSGDSLSLIIVGPGRAGSSIARAATAAGHEIVGVLSRTPGHKLGPDLDWPSALPEADMALIAVRDDAIAEVTERMAPIVGPVKVVAHLSGFVPVMVLQPLRESGPAIGGFHPLQSMPDPVRGAEALAGAHVGIGGDPAAVEALTGLGVSLGMQVFALEDAARPAYHAAAAAASNFVVASLGISADLFRSAGIEPGVSRALVERAVANAFDEGPDRALTGPVARGDVETVRGHLEAAAEVSEDLGDQFRLMVEATAIRAGRRGDLGRWR